MIEESPLTLEKLKIVTRLEELEKTVQRIDLKLFDNGIIKTLERLSNRFDAHDFSDKEHYSKIGIVATQVSILMWLFGVIGAGLIFMVLKT